MAEHSWYHSIELPDGQLTPGQVDLRRLAPKLLPDDLAGTRALDVGTFDGFWAFELERRGARVVATDLDEPQSVEAPPLTRELVDSGAHRIDLELGRGFKLAAEALGSDVERRELSVYDVTPEAVGGPVDVIFIGALLIHLRDPVGALERLRDTLNPGGRLISLEPVSLRDTLRAPRTPLARLEATTTLFNWWHPNRAAHLSMAVAAGFPEVRSLGVHRPRQQRPMKGWMHALSASRAGA
ncbi:MAG: class I SAM-dependent methyltransferase [Thermoleophilaceae bacterium]